MTIYRRRLASSFHALRQTMEKRKGGVGGLITAADEARIDENIADQVEAGEEIKPYRKTNAGQWRSKRSRQSGPSSMTSSACLRIRRRMANRNTASARTCRSWHLFLGTKAY